MAARCTCSTNTCSTKTRSCFPCSTNTCSTKTRSCFSFLFLALYCAIVLCLCFFSISSTTPWGKCFSCRSKSKTLLCLLEYFLLAIFETTAKNSVLERCGPGLARIFNMKKFDLNQNSVILVRNSLSTRMVSYQY